MKFTLMACWSGIFAPERELEASKGTPWKREGFWSRKDFNDMRLVCIVFSTSVDTENAVPLYEGSAMGMR